MVSSDCSSERRRSLDRPRRDRTELLRTLPPCRVCLEAASGFHYGVNTCEACKGFFRRALKHGTTFSCKQQKDCDVTRASRTLCSYCRFQKCLFVGMSTSAIKVGRYTHEARTRNIIEVKILAKQKNELKKSLGTSSSASWQKEEYDTQAEIRKQQLLLKQEHRLAEEAANADPSQECSPAFTPLTAECQLYPNDTMAYPIFDLENYPESESAQENHSLTYFKPPSINNGVDVASYQTPQKYEDYHEDYHEDYQGFLFYPQSAEDSLAQNVSVHGQYQLDHLPPEVYPAQTSHTKESFELPFCFDSYYNFGSELEDSQTVDTEAPTAYSSCVEQFSSNEEQTFSGDNQPPSWGIEALLPTTLEAKLEAVTKETSVYNGETHLREHLNLLRTFQQQNIRKMSRPAFSFDVIQDEIDHVINKLVEAHNRLILVSTYFPESFIQEKLKSHLKVYMMRQQVMGKLPDLPDQHYVHMYKSTGIDMDGRVNNIKVFMNYAESFLRSLVKFAKSLPGFKDLPLDDQTQLLKGCFADFWFLSVYKGYNTDLNTVLLPHGHCFHRDDLYKMFDPNWVDLSFQLAEVLQKKSLGWVQIIIIKSLLLTMIDRCNILNPAAVDNIQDLLLECLKRQLAFDHPNKNLAHVVGEAVNVMTLLRPLSELEKRNWQKRLVIENAASRPLVREMFYS